jgi:hypothetical protein
VPLFDGCEINISLTSDSKIWRVLWTLSDANGELVEIETIFEIHWGRYIHCGTAENKHLWSSNTLNIYVSIIVVYISTHIFFFNSYPS